MGRWKDRGRAWMRRVAVWSVALCLGCTFLAWAKKAPPKTITAPDGSPLRKLYIQTGAPDAALFVAAQLEQETCLTAVSNVKDADAVLDLGVALPTVGGGPPTPNIFGPSAKAQTLENAKDNSHLSTTVTCNDNKGNKNCVAANDVPAGDISALTPSGMPAGAGAQYDITVVSKLDSATQLWSPQTGGKHPWTDQLRVAAGCPVCPKKRFDRRKYKTYQEWIRSCGPSAR